MTEWFDELLLFCCLFGDTFKHEDFKQGSQQGTKTQSVTDVENKDRNTSITQS